MVFVSYKKKYKWKLEQMRKSAEMNTWIIHVSNQSDIFSVLSDIFEQLLPDTDTVCEIVHHKISLN